MVKLAKLGFGRFNQSINHSSNSFINHSNQSVWIWISRIKIQKEVYHIISWAPHSRGQTRHPVDRPIHPSDKAFSDREGTPSSSSFTLPRQPYFSDSSAARTRKSSADAAKAKYPDHKADAETGMGEQSVRHSQSYPNKTTGGSGSLDRGVAMMLDSVDC